jgi:carboxypeptidase family protein
VAARHLRGAIQALALAACLLAIVPAAAMAASISGHVTAEGGGPIAGAEVCPTPEPYSFERECVTTAADGFYLIDGLPPTSYYLRFSTPSRALNYVTEWYDESQTYPGDLIAVAGAGEAITGVDAELEPGGVIKGTATDALSGDPAGGVWVWIYGSAYGLGFRAEPDGTFEANDIPTGEYTLYFDGESEVNYLGRYYEDSDNFGSATPVSVVAGSVVDGIEQSLYPGAQILGHVSNVKTGADFSGSRVCIVQGDRERCDTTDLDGNYAIRSIPSGSYLLEFGVDWLPLTGRVVSQYWEEASTEGEADPITIAPPQTLTGIDAQIVDRYEWTPEEDGDTTPPPAASTPNALNDNPKPARKCKKGFHRKLVKGKKRCVRKHHPRQKHRR